MKKNYSFTLLLLFYMVVLNAQPSNNLIENATLVTESPYIEYNVPLATATIQNEAQASCNVSAFPTVYYKFTATHTTVNISLEDPYTTIGNTDAFALVYSAPSLNASNADLNIVSSCAFGASNTVSNLVVGNVYYVLVYRNSANGNFTKITIDIPQNTTTTERNALIDLYNATAGASWTNNTNWNTTQPVSSWHGVIIENGHVVKLYLNANNLVGTIPASITNLSYLKEIYINNNKISGELPDFSAITSMETLNIKYNDFSIQDLETNFTTNNSITTFIYEVQNKRDMEENYPGTIGNTYNLIMSPVAGTNVQYQWYTKGYNYFDPSDDLIAGATNPTYTISNLQDADMNTYLCKATSSAIPELEITRNTINISGPVSQAQRDALIAIFNATNGTNWNNNTEWLSSYPVDQWYGVTVQGNKVVDLDFSNNNLVGTLPPEIGDLVHLQSLIFYQGNSISGAIPPELGNLTELRVLSLENNNFTGTIPASFANLTKLRGLWLWDNQIEGAVPSYFATAYPNLVFLDIADNNFQGVLPDFTGLSKFKYLKIQNNYFTASDFGAQFNDYLNLQYSWNSSSYYSPQRTLDPTETINESTGVSISLYVDETTSTTKSSVASSIVYTWFKDGVALANSNANPYVITNAQTSDSGVYHCEITDSTIPDFYSVRAPITVNIGTLGANDLSVNKINVYPNPTTNYLNIKLPEQEKTLVALYSLNGQLLFQKQINNIENRLDISFLSKGMYLLSLKSENLKITKQIIKE